MCMCMCMRVNVYVCMYTSCMCMCMRVNVYVCMYVYAYRPTYMHTCALENCLVYHIWKMSKASSSHDYTCRYIALGNEPFLTNYGTQYATYTYQALYNMHQSLVKVGLQNMVKLTIPCNADVIWSTAPSKAEFRPDMIDTMKQIVSFLDQINSPFVVNIYPFLDLMQQADFPEDYAFFNGSLHPVLDGSITYTNAFDASVDMTIVALSSIGFTSMEVIIGEIGWPSDGGIHANLSNAKRFNQGLINHLASKKGTPLRPGVIVNVYLFSLLDENQKSVLPGNFERHWGVFTFDGQGKYTLDLTGQSLVSGQGRGSRSDLVNAEGVPYLPIRWCVANPKTNASHLLLNAQFACASADCTALVDGGSCSSIGAPANASYAFNSYYQLNNQDASSCFFDGLGVVTFVDPSIGDCRYLVGVFSASNKAASLISLSLLALLNLILHFSSMIECF